MPDTDVTAQNAGLEFADAVRERGLELWLAGALERPAEILRRSGLEPRLFSGRRRGALEAYAAFRRPE
jgi:hypothetical protein